MRYDWLDGELMRLPEDLLRDMLMESYRLVAAALPKRTRAELGIQTGAQGAQKREIP